MKKRIGHLCPAETMPRLASVTRCYASLLGDLRATSSRADRLRCSPYRRQFALHQLRLHSSPVRHDKKFRIKVCAAAFVDNAAAPEAVHTIARSGPRDARHLRQCSPTYLEKDRFQLRLQAAICHSLLASILARIEELLQELLFDSPNAHEKRGDEELGESWLAPNHAGLLRPCRPDDCRVLNGRCGRKPQRPTCQASLFKKKSPW